MAFNTTIDFVYCRKANMFHWNRETRKNSKIKRIGTTTYK